jgi:acyl carrier protein phosphodiesterase
MMNGIWLFSYLSAVNFLGHAYLSFRHPQILVGNMISDFVKGRAQYQYPPGIQKGIKLHRLIDDYTDGHEATRAAKEIFRPHYRLYSAPLVDVVYDHFLAADTSMHTDQQLLNFTLDTYSILDHHLPYLPLSFAAMLPYMKRDNWLYGYKTEGGILRSLQGLMRRASMQDNGSRAFHLLLEHKAALTIHYKSMMADVKDFAKGRFDELTA